MTARALLFLAASLACGSATAEVFFSGDLPRRDDRPPEVQPGLDTHYGVIDAPDGARLRTIVTRPAGTTGPLPAVFYVQWVGCDSVEFIGEGAFLDVFRGVAQRSGWAFLRVERASSGDSVGPACGALDYDTELAHYRLAFDAFVAGPHVDPARVVILANSLGTTMAPLIAQGKRVAGVVTTSGGALTYFERMLHFDRAYLERQDPARANELLSGNARFHVEYLLNGKLPAQIAAEDPALGAVWARIPYKDATTHYGRPFAYHHQLARKDLAAAWSAVDAPVLVLFNEYDEFESIHGADAIVTAVNAKRPGTARLEVLPRLNHSFYRYADKAAAFRAERGTAVPDPAPALSAILAFLRAVK